MALQEIEMRRVAGRQIVDGDDVVPGREQAVAEVAADEAGAAGDEHTHLVTDP